MGAVGAKVAGPFGLPWRAGKRPYGQAALSLAAARLKGFYLHQAALGVNDELGRKLDRTRLPSRADRNRALLGHVKTTIPANPLTPKRVRRRHPKMAPEGAKETLPATARSARDRLVVTWLAARGSNEDAAALARGLPGQLRPARGGTATHRTPPHHLNHRQ